MVTVDEFTRLEHHQRRQWEALQDKFAVTAAKTAHRAVHAPGRQRQAAAHAVAVVTSQATTATARLAETHTHQLLGLFGWRPPREHHLEDRPVVATAGITRNAHHHYRRRFSLSVPDIAEDVTNMWPRSIEAIATAKGITTAAARSGAADKVTAWVTERVAEEMSLTRRAASAASLEQRGVTRYRRALAGEGCPFCTLIADRTYSTNNLMEAHTRCQCVVVPLLPGHDASDFSDPVNLANARDTTIYRAKDRANGGPRDQKVTLETTHDPTWGPRVGGTITKETP